MRINFFLILKLAITLAITYILVENVGIAKLVSTISQFEPWHIAIFLTAVIMNLAISALNIGLMLTAIKQPVAFSKLMRYSTSSWAHGLFLPGKLGEFSILYYLKKNKVSIENGLAVAITDKVITAVVLILISLTGLYVFLTPAQFLTVFLIMSIILASMLFFVFSVKSEKILGLFVGKYSEKIKAMKKSMKTIFGRKDLLVLNVFLTIIKWLILALSIYLVFASFGEKVSFYWVFVVYATSVVISLIPVSISGLGIKEGASYFMFTQLGAEPNITLAIMFTLTAVVYSVGVLALLLTPKH